MSESHPRPPYQDSHGFADTERSAFVVVLKYKQALVAVSGRRDFSSLFDNGYFQTDVEQQSVRCILFNHINCLDRSNRLTVVPPTVLSHLTIVIVYLLRIAT